MAYKIMTRYYAAQDNYNESYVVTSDNLDKNTKLEIGTNVYLNEYPMRKDPFEWMRSWLDAYAKDTEFDVDMVMDWILSQPMSGG